MAARIGSRKHARGQSIIEFSLVAVILFPFLFTLIILLLNLGQGWSLGRAVDTMGQRIITTGAFDEGSFVDDTSNLGFPVDPLNDTLLITVTHCTDGCTQEIFSWGDGYSTAFTVRYGDLVSIEATKDLSLSRFTPVLGFLPNTKASWSGIAQRNSVPEGTVYEPPDPAGQVTGTVRDAATGAVISGVFIDFGPGQTTTTGANGRYSLNNIPIGTYSARATKSGYQDASTTVNVASGVTTVRDFSLESAAIVDVLVSLSSPANLVSNGGFEATDTSGWSPGAGLFNTAPDSFTATTAQSHSGAYAGSVTVLTVDGGGVFQAISESFIAGRTYRASAWIKAESGASVTLSFGDATTDAAGAIVGTGSWQEIVASWTPTVNSSGAEISLNQASEVGGPTDSTFFLDDVEVVDIANNVNNAVVTTSSGLTAVSVGNGHYRLSVAPGPVTIQVNTSDGKFGSTVISNAPAGSTTYVTVTVS